MTPTNWLEAAGGVVVLAFVLRNLKNMHELTGMSPNNRPVPAEVVWRRIKQDGEFVYPGDVIGDTYADSLQVEIQAHHMGTLKWIAPVGENVPSGSTIATIEGEAESYPVIVPKEYFRG